jgi:hypothetical protein
MAVYNRALRLSLGLERTAKDQQTMALLQPYVDRVREGRSRRLQPANPTPPRLP